MTVVVVAILILVGLGVAFGIVLGIAQTLFAVAVDPRAARVEAALPGVNCGACGYAGCEAYAEAVVMTGAQTNLCIPGGADVAREVAGIMGVEAMERESEKAVLVCNGGRKVADKFKYKGLADCRAARLLQNGAKECDYGCLGLGTCVAVCPVGAIRMGPEQLPIIDEDKCIGCRACENVCPVNVLVVQPVSKVVHFRCRNEQRGAVARKICANACIGCGKCEKVCPTEPKAVTVEGFLARHNYELCISCGKCVEVCPTGVIVNLKEKRKKKDDKHIQTATV